MKRLIALFLLIAALTAMLCPAASAADEQGLTFTDDLYRTQSAVTQPIRTYEAWLRFPAGIAGSTRGGAIFGCSINDYDSVPTVDFEVMAGGLPRLLWKTADRSVTRDLTFNKVNLYTGKKLHLAITFDNSTGEAKCYVDGVLRQTLKVDPMTALTPHAPYGIGGTPYSGNPFYFKGELFSVAAYSDCRTEQEIKNDMLMADTDDHALVFSYELDDMTAGEPMLDYGNHRYDAALIDMWMTEEEMQAYREEAGYADYDYAIAVIGDTQTITNHFPDQLHYIYDWIAAHAEEKKIAFVQGLGDITDLDLPREYELVKGELEKLDGVVPYSLIRGNHDNIPNYTKYISYGEYGGSPDESFDGTMLNTYETIRLGTVDFLMLHLDYAPSDEVLAWANKVVKEHPEHNVIISTHAYLNCDGKPIDVKIGDNNGTDLWNKLISKHQNIVLVLSGHVTWDEILIAQQQSKKGNTVTQILIDPQGTDGTLKGRMADSLVGGMVSMLYFSENGTKLAVECVSTARDKYYMSSNLQTVTLDIDSTTRARAEEFSRTVARALEREITEENYADRKTLLQSLREEYNAMSEKTRARVSADTLEQLSAAEKAIAALENPETPEPEQPSDTDDASTAGSGNGLLIGGIGGGAAVVIIAIVAVLCLSKKRKA